MWAVIKGYAVHFSLRALQQLFYFKHISNIDDLQGGLPMLTLYEHSAGIIEVYTKQKDHF